MGDSTPAFRSHRGHTTSGDRATIDFFATNAPPAASLGFCGPLGRYTPRAADTGRRTTQEAVKRKIARDTPLRMIIDDEEQDRI